MSKSVLGRGLRSLMGEAKTGKGESPKSEPAAKQPPLAGPGVDSLLHGARRREKDFSARQPNIFVQSRTASAEKSKTKSPAKVIPRWYFFAADVLLLLAALLVVYESSGALSRKEIFFCTAAIVLGGILG